VILTKVTPAIGLLWFVVRGEWRRLGIALGVTAGIAAVSYLLTPGLWAQWAQVLAANAGGVVHRPVGPWLPEPLPLRVAVAAGLVVWGALANRPASLAIAALLALPVVWGTSLAMIVAVVPLALRDWRPHAGAEPYAAALARVLSRFRAPRQRRRDAPVTAPPPRPLLPVAAYPDDAPSRHEAAKVHPIRPRVDSAPPSPGGRSEA
jgi:hypothetical protein